MLLRALGMSILFTGLAAAQTPAERAPRGGAPTPAERASGNLNRDVRADRFRDAAQDARGENRPTRPEVQQFDSQRRTLQPDVGRPEQEGRTSTGAPSGGLPSMGPNPQR